MAFDVLTDDERHAFLVALARSFHRDMDPLAIAYLIPHFEKALAAIGWGIQPKTPLRSS